MLRQKPATARLIVGDLSHGTTGAQLLGNAPWTKSVLQCFVAMSRFNLSGFGQTPANAQHR
jgi:hypothetical protein